MVTVSRALTASLSIAIAVSITTTSIAIAAPTKDEEKAGAELFTEGRAAMEKSDFATACPKFEASVKLVRRSGTLFALSKCAEKDGHLVKAAEYFRDGIVMLPVGDDRQAESKDKLAAMERRIPHVSLTLPTDAPDGTRLQLDDLDVKPGGSLAVDPGQHAWIVTAAGHGPRRDNFTLAEGEQRTVTVALGPDAPDAPPPVAGGSSADATRSGTGRKVGFAFIGIGATSLIAGGITGAMTLGKKSTADANCTANSCNATGLAAEKSGKTFSTISTVTFIGGAALAGAGVVSVLTSKSQPRREARRTTLAAQPLFGGGLVSFGTEF